MVDGAARTPGATRPAPSRAARSPTISRLKTGRAPRQAPPNDRRSLKTPPGDEPSPTGVEHTIPTGRYLALISSKSNGNGAPWHQRVVARVRRTIGPCPTSSRARPVRIYSSMRTTRSIGCLGAEMRWPARSSLTARSSCRSATPRAIGATSWSANRSRTRRRPRCSTTISCRSRSIARSDQTSTPSTCRRSRR